MLAADRLSTHDPALPGDRPFPCFISEISHAGGLGRACDQPTRFLTSHACAAWTAASVESPTSGVASKDADRPVEPPGTAKPFSEVRAEAAKVGSAISLGEAFGLAGGHFDERRVLGGAARADERRWESQPPRRKGSGNAAGPLRDELRNVMEQRPGGLSRLVRAEWLRRGNAHQMGLPVNRSSARPLAGGHGQLRGVSNRPFPPARPRCHTRARSPHRERRRRSGPARLPGRSPAARRRSRPRSRPPPAPG